MLIARPTTGTLWEVVIQFNNEGGNQFAELSSSDRRYRSQHRYFPGRSPD
jgi:hypothetical protein